MCAARSRRGWFPRPDPTPHVYVVSFGHQKQAAVYVRLQRAPGYNRFRLICQQREATLADTYVRFTDTQLRHLVAGQIVEVQSPHLRITQSM